MRSQHMDARDGCCCQGSESAYVAQVRIFWRITDLDVEGTEIGCAEGHELWNERGARSAQLGGHSVPLPGRALRDGGR